MKTAAQSRAQGGSGVRGCGRRKERKERFRSPDEHCEHVMLKIAYLIKSRYARVIESEGDTEDTNPLFNESPVVLLRNALNSLGYAALWGFVAVQKLYGSSVAGETGDCWYHCNELCWNIAEATKRKYNRGQRVHKDKLWQRPDKKLARELLEEIIDGMVYGITLLEKLEGLDGLDSSSEAHLVDWRLV